RPVRVGAVALDDDRRDRIVPEAEVDDLRAVPDGEADAARDIAVVARPVSVEHLDRQYARGWGDSGDANPVPGHRGDDPRDVRAVPVVVLGDLPRAARSRHWRLERAAGSGVREHVRAWPP